MPKNFGKCFHIHSAFQGARCKGVAQRMKAPMRYIEVNASSLDVAFGLKISILYLRFLTSKFRAMKSKKTLKIKVFSGQYLFYRPVMVAEMGFEPSNSITAKPCISSRRSLAYHQFRRNCISSLRKNIQPTADEIHASRDDIRLAAMIYHCFRNG